MTDYHFLKSCIDRFPFAITNTRNSMNGRWDYCNIRYFVPYWGRWAWIGESSGIRTNYQKMPPRSEWELISNSLIVKRDIPYRPHCRIGEDCSVGYGRSLSTFPTRCRTCDHWMSQHGLTIICKKYWPFFVISANSCGETLRCCSGESLNIFYCIQRRLSYFLRFQNSKDHRKDTGIWRRKRWRYRWSMCRARNMTIASQHSHWKRRCDLWSLISWTFYFFNLFSVNQEVLSLAMYNW